MRGAKRQDGPFAKRVVAGRQSKQQHAEAVQIALGSGAPAGEDLGRQIRGCSHQAFGRRARFLEVVAGAEVAEHHASARSIAEDVRRFDVPVHEPCRVDGRQRVAHLEARRDELIGTEGAAAGELFLERPPLDELHREARDVVDALRAVNGHDVRMADAGHEAAFGDHITAAWQPMVVFVDQLQRDVAIERGIAGAVHVSEPAATDVGLDAQRAQDSPGLKRGRERAGEASRVADADANSPPTIARSRNTATGRAFVRRGGALLRGAPVERAAVSYRFSQRCDSFSRRHGETWALTTS